MTDVWSDGLTVYYCRHLVTKQSKVSGHRRPDPCCGVTCDCSQARLSPLAPQLVTAERWAADTGERASWPVSAGAVHTMFTRGSKNAFHSAQARLAELADGVGIVTTRLSWSPVRVCAKMVEYALCGLRL